MVTLDQHDARDIEFAIIMTMLDFLVEQLDKQRDPLK